MADIQAMAEATDERGKLGDMVVLTAMTAFCLALAVGFNHQLGLPIWLAGGVAASIFAGCLALHLLLLRSIKIGRLEAEVARLRRQGSRSAPASERQAETPAKAKAELAPGTVRPVEASAPAAAEDSARIAVDSTAPVSGQASTTAVTVTATGSIAAEVPVAKPDTAPAAAQVEAAKTSDPRPTDFEMIQSLVKKLAADVAANERRDASATAAAAVAESAVDSSVEALKVTAETLHRQEAANDPATGLPAPLADTRGSAPVGHEASIAKPAQPVAATPATHPELIALASAIKSQRIDVMLEPILGLREQRPSHYEVSLRFRDEAGGKIGLFDNPGDLSGSGLLPLIDITRLSRTAEVARRLKQRGADGAVFSDLAAESLVDSDFLNRVADAYRAESQFADGLVMAFTQAEARTFSPAQWETLLHMRDLGFRFSLKDITDLDMDFEALAKVGFQFAKLDAEVFLVGLPMDGGTLPSRDICRHLADAGLALIVGHIGDEQQLVHVLGFGALFGQGALFGEPRPMKAELFSRPASAAA